ncbi:ribose 5-phosphate isomerase B [Moheibacter sediminis]|uniref:Ribose 5-phosphate isomerase B n=1 Tax=Moheibacter sediminis TaxID=1434700 RepID=A0A1W1Y861_9FLAO|nr:ribose 5-phosphate isomerase B [Moheibacter sediminis]SMC32011.1 ribose 5-phosphate isomerase B [Moheibacter sediminis]
MKIAIGSDHAGFVYKSKIAEYLTSKGFQVQDFGTLSTESVDFPDFAHPTASAVENGEAEFGILICGSGQGVNMTANKHQGVRSALCWNTDIARLTRQHNNANIIALPARFVALEYAIEMVDTFLSTDFEGGRHENRVAKIACS